MAKGLFISDNDQVTVTVYSGEAKSGSNRYWIHEDDQPEGIVDVERHEAVFRRPTFRDSSLLMDASIRGSLDGAMDVAFAEVRLLRLQMLIKSWSLTDDQGNNVEPSNENIEKLNPSFAFTLSAALEQALGIDASAEIEALSDRLNESQTDQAEQSDETDSQP